MDGIGFEQNYRVHFYETDMNQELGVINLLNYFEEVSVLQSEARGVGLEYLRSNNLVWLLHKWSLSIIKPPRFGQVLKIKTLPVSIAGFMGYRKFWAFDENGDTMVTADSAWIFLNTSTKRPTRVNDDMKRAYGHLNTPESKMEMPVVDTLNICTYNKKFEIHYSDIDINRHVNNTRYVHWAIETLPEPFLNEKRLASLIVEYVKETAYGQEINSEVEIIEEDGLFKCSHRITSGAGSKACLLSTVWVSR